MHALIRDGWKEPRQPTDVVSAIHSTEDRHRQLLKTKLNSLYNVASCVVWTAYLTEISYFGVARDAKGVKGTPSKNGHQTSQRSKPGYESALVRQRNNPKEEGTEASCADALCLTLHLDWIETGPWGLGNRQRVAYK